MIIFTILFILFHFLIVAYGSSKNSISSSSSSVPSVTSESSQKSLPSTQSLQLAQSTHSSPSAPSMTLSPKLTMSNSSSIDYITQPARLTPQLQPELFVNVIFPFPRTIPTLRPVRALTFRPATHQNLAPVAAGEPFTASYYKHAKDYGLRRVQNHNFRQLYKNKKTFEHNRRITY